MEDEFTTYDRRHGPLSLILTLVIVGGGLAFAFLS